MINVLLILEDNPNHIGGIERHCFNILEMFNKDSEISVSSISKKDIIYKRILNTNKVYFSFSQLKNKIKQSNCDVIHVHGFSSFIAFQAIYLSLKMKKKVIFTPHFHPFYTMNNPFLGKLFFQFFFRKYIKKVDIVIAINKEECDFFSTFHDNVVLIPNWINIPDWPRVHSPITNELNLVNILFVGKANNKKGIEYLKKIPLEKYVVNCVTDKFIHEGFNHYFGVSESTLIDLYMNTTLVVIPSKYEAFSYVALEAITLGKPILVSNKVRILDHLPKNTHIVHEFPYGDFESFLSKINLIKELKIDTEREINMINKIFDKRIIKEKMKHIYSVF